MEVGVVCPYDLGRPGGVQQQTRELVGVLEGLGHRPRLVAAGEAVGRTVTVPANRSQAPVTVDPRAWRRVVSALEGVDVVHVHEPFVPLVGWAALATGRPTVLTFHARPARWTRALYRAAAPFLRRLSDRHLLTAVSPVAAAALPASWGRVELVPNGLHVASYRLDVPRDPLRVVFVGRDEPRKGLDVILAAWPEILRRLPGAHLHVVGARRPEAPPGVEYLGTVDEGTKRRELAQGSVFVAPNLGGESFGVVVAEAMAAGCAPVVSDLEAFRWVTGGGAILTPVGDVSRVASAVVDLLSDPGERARIAAAARRRVEDFDWSVVGRAYDDVYRRAVAGWRP